MHQTRTIACCVAALILAASGLSAAAQIAPKNTGAATASEQNWWRNAVIYEIYPRSFQDSNEDGIGDLNGITERLDYLKELGVDAIWLTPCYPSPQVDFGYDISDYKNIDPQYGTLKDFDRLVAEADKRHIRILMDMVMNHTSDKHKWFIQSRSSRTNPYRDWYMWHDGKGENPKIHQAFKDIIAFWLKRGVGGFRFDAITTLFEDSQMRDEDVLLDKDGKTYLDDYGDIALNDTRTNNLPGTHPVMQEFRAFSDTFNSNKFPGTRVLIGETYLNNIAELAKQYGTPEKPEFQLPMDTQVGFIDKLDVAEFRAKLNDVETGVNGNIPLLVFTNHDRPRLDARYGDGVHDNDIARVISTMLFASRGASLFYYGDEIGMKTTPPTRKEDVKDPVGLTGWPKDKGRDGERTPMQWDAEPNAGFSKAGVKTWLPVPPNSTSINVKAEEGKPDSLFTWYQTLIRLKKTVPALARGDNVMLDTSNAAVLSWVRQTAGAPSVVIAANFTAEPQTVSLSVAGASGTVKTLLKTPGAADPASIGQIQLGPFGVYIGELQ